MRKIWSYFKDSGHFSNKSRSLGKVPDFTILFTTNVVDLYPRIPHNVGLRALKEPRERREQKNSLQRISYKFVLKSNFFEFNYQIKQQISGTVIGTTCVPMYVCIFKGKVETEFLET